jgi:hypothetical protein
MYFLQHLGDLVQYLLYIISAKLKVNRIYTGLGDQEGLSKCWHCKCWHCNIQFIAGAHWVTIGAYLTWRTGKHISTPDHNYIITFLGRQHQITETESQILVTFKSHRVSRARNISDLGPHVLNCEDCWKKWYLGWKHRSPASQISQFHIASQKTSLPKPPRLLNNSW